MKDEIRDILEKQAAWQHSRAGKSWGDKLRASARMRRVITAMQRQKGSARAL